MPGPFRSTGRETSQLVEAVKVFRCDINKAPGRDSRAAFLLFRAVRVPYD